MIADAYGVFVASSGNDTTGDGSMANPYLTLGKAIASVGSKHRVYACADGAAYNEQVTITAAVDLFGGFSCGGNAWAYTGTASKLTASSLASFPELKVDSVASAVNVVDFEIDGANATSGGTSVAVWLNSSPMVTLTRVKVVGGEGAKGADGANGSTTPNYTGANAPNGNGATTVIGGLAQPSACANSVNSLGGGAGTTRASNGSPGTPARIRQPTLPEIPAWPG